MPNASNTFSGGYTSSTRKTNPDVLEFNIEQGKWIKIGETGPRHNAAVTLISFSEVEEWCK